VRPLGEDASATVSSLCGAASERILAFALSNGGLEGMYDV
jgi:hypothetical protein